AVRVSPGGRIVFPFVGSVTVLDKTTEEVAKILSGSAALNKQYNTPPLAVSVKEYAPMTAFVLGAVQHPQPIGLPMDLPMTLTQAIAQAEGFREDAARQNVRVYRRDKAGNTTTLTVNVAQILDENKPQDDVVLKAGDTIYVSPRASGGVFVLGAVQHPGFFDLKSFNRGGDEDTITVTQALAAAGGFTEDAVEEGVRLFRRKSGRDGDVNLQETVNVTEVTDGGLKTVRKDPALVPGDTVFVPPRDKIFVVGRVIKAGAYSAPQGQKLTVTKAISLAGGFDPYAERSNVKIFRHDAPGAQPEIVDVKKLFSSGDLRSDSVVNPGDLIFVPESIW
ncbi:MAG TPA: SLBB domain-containing protein, partial [Planctomycetota bacterium]|nr:SLBB domain-containing protein [Planctomycetota bacterium]